MKWTIEEIIRAVGGKCLNTPEKGNNLITSICTDSRKIEAGSLFVPLKGEKFDGHLFIPSVYEKGAVAVVTEKSEVEDKNLYMIQVTNTKRALLDLAKYYRSCFTIPVIGVTGSVGKTTTKDIIAAVLSGKFLVHKTQGNFNNEIGLPLTLFEMQEHHQVAVVEMGMNHFGEIHELTQVAKPTIAVITNIGTSHIENLGSREGILKAKLEILDGLDNNGLLLLNGDDDLLQTVDNLPFTVKTYGFDKKHMYYAKDIISYQDTMKATVVTPKDTYAICIHGLGEHMVLNALAGIAIGEYLGLTKQEILTGITSYVPGKMRMNKKLYENGITVIDDTYNASLDSMCAAIKVLENTKPTGKKIAVLGDMLEMGEYGPEFHKKVGEFAAHASIDRICAVGELATYIYEEAKQSATIETCYFPTKELFEEQMKNILSPGDIVLFKASRGMHFEKMVEAVGKVNK